MVSTPRRWPRAGRSAAPSRTRSRWQPQERRRRLDRGFFERPGPRLDDVGRDTTIRPDTSLEKLAKLAPAFDRTSGQGSLTAGNSRPPDRRRGGDLVATEGGLARLPAETRARGSVDYEVNAIDLFNEYLLMAPAYAIPRLLARNGLTYEDIGLWRSTKPSPPRWRPT